MCTMDAIDRAALHRLMRDGRLSWAELASALGLSPAATAERVRRLERRGLIRGYAALAAPDALGLDLTAFVAVTLERAGDRAGFLARVADLDVVQECHHVAGDYDYLLKLRCTGTRDLERLISLELKDGLGVATTRTIVVLSTTKESAVLPLPAETLPTSEAQSNVAAPATRPAARKRAHATGARNATRTRHRRG